MSEKSNKIRNIIIQFVLFILIVAAGIIVARVFVTSRKPPAKQKAEVPAPLVKSYECQAEDIQMIVQGYGTVAAKLEAQLVTQVSGNIIALPLSEGDFFKAGQVIVKIDPRDYELGVQKAKAEVASAKVKLEQEEAEAVVAKTEWNEMNPGVEPDSPLVFREPQIKEAKANLLSAAAKLDSAKLDLERTSISVPFDGRLNDKKVDLGQYVRDGESLIDVYGIDAVEINVPLEDFELEWFDIKNGSEGSEAIVSADFAGKLRRWNGRVVRSAGQIDPKSRMVHVIVEVEKPFEYEAGGVPLTPGMFVDVSIKGKTLKNAIAVPRGSVHNRDQVWVANDGHLKIKTVKIARSDRAFSYTSEGLEAGDVIITSPIDAVVDGMRIRLVEEQKESSN